VSIKKSGMRSSNQPRIEVLSISRNFRFFLAVFIPAILLRVIFLITLDEDILFFKYPYFAEKLVAGESIGERLTDLSPVYLYLLTLFRWLTPLDWNALKFIQAVVGAVNCWLAAELGRRVFASRIVGLLAGWCLVIYGNLIVLETTLEPTVFVIFFNLLAVTFLYRFADSLPASAPAPKHDRWLLLSGIFTGVSILTKPSFLLFIPLAGLWICLLAGGASPWRRTVRRLLLFGAVSMGIVLIITLRNYILLGDRILVTADAGKVFYHGNARQATAVIWAGLPGQGFIQEVTDEPDYAHVIFRNVASEHAGRQLKPSESSRYWTHITLKDITSDPGRYLSRQLEKLLFFFSDYELHYIASAYTEYKASRAWPFLPFAPLVGLGLMGMLLAGNRFKRLLPIYGMVGLYLVSGLIYVVQSRYRIPMVPYLCLFAAFAIYRSQSYLSRRRLSALLAIIVGCTLLVIGSRIMLQEQINATDRWFQATKLHYEIGAKLNFHAGRYPEAIESATKTLEIAPAFAPAYNLRGKSRALLGDSRTAKEDFKKVIHLSPNRPEGYRNLGFAYLTSQDNQAALKYLKKARALDPEDQKVRKAIDNLTQPDRKVGDDQP